MFKLPGTACNGCDSCAVAGVCWWLPETFTIKLAINLIFRNNAIEYPI